MTQRRSVVTDLTAAIANAVEDAATAVRKHQTTAGITDRWVGWFLNDANSGTGWKGERPQFPKIDRRRLARTVVNLRKHHDMTSKQIAAVTGLTDGAVRQILSRHRRAEGADASLHEETDAG